MPTITAKTSGTDPAVLASSGGEALHAESTSSSVAAVAGFQLDTTDTSSGAGVYGEARGGGAAVAGLQTNPDGNGPGVYAEAQGNGAAVLGRQVNTSGNAAGVSAECLGSGHAISGVQMNPASAGAGIYAEHVAGLTAGFFRGNVIVTGDVSFPGADCAEEFIVKETSRAEPGTVMTLIDSGELEPCETPYDKRVVGVVAGAGPLKSGIVMGRRHDRTRPRQPIALVGTTYCKVDAQDSPITVGSLLTSSSTPGHAIAANDPMRAFGAVLGKAMAPLASGLGLIPILITLQ